MAIVAFACALMIDPPASALLRQPHSLTADTPRSNSRSVALRPVPALAISAKPTWRQRPLQALPAPAPRGALGNRYAMAR